MLQIKPRVHNTCKASTQPTELHPNPNLSMLCRQKCLQAHISAIILFLKLSLLHIISTSDFHPHCYFEMLRSVSTSVYLAPQQYSTPSISLVLFRNSYLQDSINHAPPKNFLPCKVLPWVRSSPIPPSAYWSNPKKKLQGCFSLYQTPS